MVIEIKYIIIFFYLRISQYRPEYPKTHLHSPVKVLLSQNPPYLHLILLQALLTVNYAINMYNSTYILIMQLHLVTMVYTLKTLLHCSFYDYMEILIQVSSLAVSRFRIFVKLPINLHSRIKIIFSLLNFLTFSKTTLVT